MRRKKTKKRLSTRLLALALSLTMVVGSFASNRLMVRASDDDGSGVVTTDEQTDPSTPQTTDPGEPQGTDPGEPQGTDQGEPQGTDQGEPQGMEPGTPEQGTDQSTPEQGTDPSTPASGTDQSTPEPGTDPATGTTETPAQAEPVVITFTATEGGAVTAERQELLTAEDMPMPVTAIAGEGYAFVNWTLDGAVVTDFATFTPDRANAAYVANFKAVETVPEEDGKVVITFIATEGGSVSVEKQELLTEEDEVQEVTATADEGFIFKNWTKDGAVVSENAAFTPDRESAAYVANFESEDAEKNIVITFTATEGGTVSLEKQELGKDDTVMPVTAIADEGFVLVNWTLNDEEVSTEETFTPVLPENIDELEEIEYVANFEPAAFEYEETINGVTVFLAAKEGVFPVGTTVTVEPMQFEEIKEVLEEKLNADAGNEVNPEGESIPEEKIEVVDAVFFDINFFDEEGTNIQPDGIVRVRFSGIELQIPEELKEQVKEEDLDAAVFHIDDSTPNQTVEIVDDSVKPTDTVVEVETEQFSPYGVATYANTNGVQQPTGNYHGRAGYVMPYYATGTAAKGDYRVDTLWIQDGSDKVAYCFNWSRDWPTDHYFGKVENATDLDMDYYSGTGTSLTGARIRSNVLRVVYNGFPNNASGFQQKYYLTNDQFRTVTQLAVWKYTDGQGVYAYPNNGKYYVGSDKWSTYMNYAYYDLVNGGATPPAEYELDLYICKNSSKQNLLSTRMGEPSEETTEISVKKNWNHNGNTNYPSTITVNLYADGVVKGTFDIKAPNWSVKVTGLPKKSNGTNIKYEIKEVNVDGYESKVTGSATSGFTITNTFKPKEYSVRFKKVDSASGRVLSGATFNLYQGYTYITTWQSGSGEETVPNLKPGTYTVEETVTPSGYTTIPEFSFTLDESGNVTNVTNQTMVEVTGATATKSALITVKNEKALGSLELRKTFTGAGLTTAQKNNIYFTVTGPGNYSRTVYYSDFGYYSKYTLNNLAIGEYTVKEYNADVAGYTVKTTYTNNGKATVETGKTVSVTVTNNYTENTFDVGFKKVGSDGTALANAKFEVRSNQTGASVGTFTSQSFGTESISGLKAGTYTVSEVVTPYGYKKIADFTFTLDGNGKVTAVSNPTMVSVSTYTSPNTITIKNEEATGSLVIYKNVVGVENLTPAQKRLIEFTIIGPNGYKKTVTYDQFNGNSYTLTPLKLGTYLVTETKADLPGYKVVKTYSVNNGQVEVLSNQSSFVTVTNTYTFETTSVSGTKTWSDNNNQDGVRPSQVTIVLTGTAGGVQVSRNTYTAVAANNWTYSFNNLPKYHTDGKEITYTVSEEAVPGYTASVNGNNILNTHTPATTQVTGTKNWDDKNNQDGKRPASVTVHLYADGTDTGKSQVVTAQTRWSYSFTNLAKYAGGREIVYTVSEEAVAGYATNYTTTATANGTQINITNSYTPGKVSVSVQKVWDDGNNQDGIRPADVTVELFANNKATGQKATLNEGNGWAHSFTELDQKQGGLDIAYTIKEVAVTGYTVKIEQVGGNKYAYVITNTHEPAKKTIEGEKKWVDDNNRDGLRPYSVTVTLYANGKPYKTAIASNASNWKYSFTDLPVNGPNAQGQIAEIEYTVGEENIPAGYELTVEGYVLTNTHTPELTNVSGTKSWYDNNDQDGVRPDSITVTLLADGQPVPGQTKTVSEADNWTYEFTNLPVNNNGRVIRYSVKEEGVPAGYTSVKNGMNLSNTYTPETTTVSGQKTWNDNNNQDAMRPTSIQVTLLANGQPVPGQVKTVTAGDGWQYSFTNLPKKANGVDITYTVQEVAVGGYTTTVNGMNLTNTHEPEVTEVSVVKNWSDNNNQDGKRPASITVELYANGVKQTQKLVLNEDNDWQGSFTNLPKKAYGALIDYTVKEIVPAGYEVSMAPTNGGFILTNTHNPTVIDINGKKTWSGDNNDADGNRPDSITVTLYKNDTEVVRSAVVTADNNWAYKFENLPEYENGAKIKYTVDESEVAQYTKKINGYNITNTYNPEKTSIKVTKKWEDVNNQDGKRPTEVVVNLLADGVKTGESAKLNAGNNWTAEFKDLIAKKDNKLITYSVEEVVPDGYQAAYGTAADGATEITNSYTPGEITVSAKKFWSDNNNQDGTRPTEIVVALIKNATGEELQTVTLNEGNGWTASFDSVPQKEGGKDIEYRVEEISNPDGYMVIYKVGDNDTNIVSGTGATVNITNMHSPEKTRVEVQKTWNDRNNAEGKRPQQIELTLNKNGVAYKTEIVKGTKNTWTYAFEDLDKFENGAEIIYTVTEKPVDGYTATVGDPAVDGNNITVSITNDENTRKIYFKKTDVANEELSGATVKVSRADGTPVDQWVSNGTAKELQLEPGDYIFEEVAAPKGYEIATTIHFTVEADGKVTSTETTVTGGGNNVVTMVDNYSDQEVEISKQDIYGAEVPGARLQITNQAGDVVAEWETDGNRNTVKLQPGTYTLHEDAVPNGYVVATDITFTVDYLGNITSSAPAVTVNGRTVPAVVGNTVNMIDNYRENPVEISKRNIAGEEIAGATLTIKDASGKTVATWISEGGQSKTVVLKPGTYTLTETSAPNGYEVAESVTFTIAVDGTVTSGALEEETGKVVMIDKYSDKEVKVSKRDITGTNELTGAKLTISTADGETVDTWESVAGVTHTKKLQPGDYVLTEVTAPKGYEVAEQIEFTVTTPDAQGNMHVVVKGNKQTDDTVIMKDDYSEQPVKVSKVEIAGTTELPGADLVILNEKGEEVIKWTSTTTQKEVSLQPGTYTLKEENAPAGYVVANPITFVVSAPDENGKSTVTVAGTPVNAVVMEDDFDNGKVKISKVDIAGKEIAGAKLKITKETVNGEIVEEWTSEAGNSKEVELYPGTYVLTETTAPDGYEKAESITFTVTKNGDQTVVKVAGAEVGAVVMKDEYAPRKVTISKVELAGGTELPGATLTLSGTPTDKTKKFETVTWESTGSARVFELQPGTYTLKEDQAPLGYDLAAEITFTLDKDGKVTLQGKTTAEAEAKVVMVNELHKIDIEVTKSWDDNDNQDGYRTNAVVVELYADGVATGQKIALNEGNKWTAKFEQLDQFKYANSKSTEIKYTVVEVTKIAEYENPQITGSAADGFLITNKHTPETVDLSGTKIWDDQDNQDGVRPETINVTLQKTVNNVTEEVLTLTVTKDNWNYEFKGLPVFENGARIKYSVKEQTVATGYTTTVDVLDLKNSYKPEETNVTVLKNWADDNDRDGIRPTSITVNLLANGTQVDTVKLSEANKWKHNFTGLPLKENGTEITYTIEEVTVGGYTTKIEASATNAKDFTITNTHTPETVDLTGTKTWNDNANQDGLRPTEIKVVLYADNTKVDPENAITVTGDERAATWDYEFKDLPKYRDGGIKIVYSVREEVVAKGYTNGYDGMNLTNTHAPGKTSLNVSKNWEDANNQDGKRPAGITVKLLADGVDTGMTVTLNAGNHWTGSFSNLDEKKAGRTIVYTVEEISVDGYTTGITTANNGRDVTITNTHVPEVTDVPVKKVWNDKNNQDGKRPAEITFNLYMEGSADVVASTTLKGDSKSEEWTYTFTGLPKYKGGVLIKYYVDEVLPVDSGYTKELNGLTATNTYAPEKVSIPVIKRWVDDGDRDRVRPATITVNLLADGEDTGKTVVLSVTNGWTDTFKDLDKYKEGKVITYTVQETGVAADVYTTQYKYENGNAEIINTHEPERTSVNGIKMWEDDDDRDGTRPESITVNLLANGQPTGQTATVSETTGWKFEFKDLLKYENGELINYTVTEDAVADYTMTSITGSMTDGYTITNEHTPGRTSVTVNKVWDDAHNQDNIRPSRIKVELLKKIKGSTDDPKVVDSKEITPDSNGNWSYTFDNLFVKESGKELEYSVREAENASLTGNAQTGYASGVNGYTITNVHTPETVEVSAKKVWDDRNNDDAKRPTQITFNLYDNLNNLVDTKVVDVDPATGDAEVTFTNLPKNRRVGGVNGYTEEIAYRVDEAPVTDYTKTVEGNMKDGFEITNAYTPEETQIAVLKIWDDAEDQDGLRPEKVTVKLFADEDGNGPVDTGETVELNKENGWAASFDHLDKYRAGREIVYTVKEVEEGIINGDLSTGYVMVSTEATQNVDNSYTITNKHKPETVSVEGTKTWDDDANRDGILPESVTIVLLANNIEVDRKTVTAKDEWKYSFTDLPRYEKGVEISYTIEEAAVAPGYQAIYAKGKFDDTTKVHTLDITNVHTPGKVAVHIAKVWNDAGNADGIRPGSVTIRLYADGADTGKTLTLTAPDWSGSFTDLDEYKPGEVGAKIVYTISEDTVAGYATAITENEAGRRFTVTNTHTPPETPPPTTPPTPPENPDNPNPPPPPTETPQVAGVRRTDNESRVLGARRGQTGERSNARSVMAMALAGLGAIAIALAGKKKKEEE